MADHRFARALRATTPTPRRRVAVVTSAPADGMVGVSWDGDDTTDGVVPYAGEIPSVGDLVDVIFGAGAVTVRKTNR